ncbi:MAG: hypothetical protein ACI9NY_001517 [Kiritimatiellia bacterium]|jgi:hypothetical protein
MSQTKSQLLSKLSQNPSSVEFAEVIDVINATYHYTPSSFSNGLGENKVLNESSINEGSCRIFAFAQLNKLTEEQTLQCFGDYYRKAVLANPEAHDHANIRTFMCYGWAGIVFDQVVLIEK